MIKTLFFDLGNVLLFFSHDKMYRQIAALCGVEDSVVKELLFDQGLGQRYETGLMTTDNLFDLIKSLGPHAPSSEELFQAVGDIFVLHEAMIPLLKELKKQYRLILISNISEAHYLFINQHFEIFSYFDDLVLSYQVQAHKPDPRIYQKALSVSNSQPFECFYIDDVPEFVAAAAMLGIQGHVFRSLPLLESALKLLK